MESDLELSMASKAEDLFQKYSPEEINKIREEYMHFTAEIDREKMAKDEVINNNDRDAKMEDYNAEEMNIIANVKMLRRRRKRLMRHHFRRRQIAKKNFKSPVEESFTSDSDDEIKIALEEEKRLMEKAIQENMTWSLTARGEVIINTNDGDALKMADEKMFPRRRGRLIRYLRRQRSKSEDSAFQIEFHHLQLPMAEKSFMSYSDQEIKNGDHSIRLGRKLSHRSLEQRRSGIKDRKCGCLDWERPHFGGSGQSRRRDLDVMLERRPSLLSLLDSIPWPRHPTSRAEPLTLEFLKGKRTPDKFAEYVIHR
ncbi:hypothetical protein ISN44_As10g011040 [Arabidopsis suecica]|uniref:Uncharacterized protein n=1 Tax=Arabidopsis suecica TaxID=45249 RepID=A0A8T1ZWF8_ARASU|nr:hypothetical protein ISN44_As10g011040 [Arabidopsis suecica]